MNDRANYRMSNRGRSVIALAVMTVLVIGGGIGTANTGSRYDAVAVSGAGITDARSGTAGQEKICRGKIALTFDDDVIIGLSQEISY